ncbi:MAG: response regulator [Bdellovibrionales bacterium]|nr:response regulator [Bdellovibrionales bacterium]
MPNSLPQAKFSAVIFSEILNNNKWLTSFLEKYQLDVELVQTGRELLEVALSAKPDVVIMDVQMPEVTGLDAIRTIKSSLPHTKTILLSSVGSYSIGQTAIELEVDLYCDKSRRAVSVVRFLKTLMGIKTFTRSKPTKTLSGADLSQRMKDRYPVTGHVNMIFEDKTYPGIFENISLGGAKIRVTQIPPLPSEIHLSWSFKGSTPFHLHAVTVRQNMVFEPQDEFVWVVGIKFMHLTTEQIKNLSELVSQISNFYEKKFEFVDFEQIRKMIGRQEKYFQAILQGHQAPMFIEKAMQEIRDYERIAFGQDTNAHQMIAKLLSFRVVCRVLRKSLEWVQIHPEEGLKQCIPLIILLLQYIDQTEADVDELIREESNLELKKNLVESSNLILEQKDKLIQSFYDRCHMLTPDEIHKDGFDSILERYKELQSYQHFLEVESQVKEKKILEAHKPSMTMYKVSPKTKAKKEQTIVAKKQKLELQKIRQNIVPTICGGIALAIIIFHCMNFYHSFVDLNEAKLSLAASKIRIKNLAYVEVHADIRTWEALDEARKRKVMDELEVFLTAHELYQAKIIDKDRLIAAVYSTHDPKQLRYAYEIF